MSKLKPFTVGERVRWKYASIPHEDGFIDVEGEATVRSIKRNVPSASGWVVSVEWQGQLLRGYDSGWFEMTKSSKLKQYFNV